MDDVEQIDMQHVATVHQHRDARGRITYEIHVDKRVIGLAHKLSQVIDTLNIDGRMDGTSAGEVEAPASA